MRSGAFFIPAFCVSFAAMGTFHAILRDAAAVVGIVGEIAVNVTCGEE